MLTQEKLKRINVLARKAKSTGLTNEERIEQQQLREEYIKSFRNEFRKQLDSIQFVDDTTPPIQ